jgi:hypothetical protein
LPASKSSASRDPAGGTKSAWGRHDQLAAVLDLHPGHPEADQFLQHGERVHVVRDGTHQRVEGRNGAGARQRPGLAVGLGVVGIRDPAREDPRAEGHRPAGARRPARQAPVAHVLAVHATAGADRRISGHMPGPFDFRHRLLDEECLQLGCKAGVVDAASQQKSNCWPQHGRHRPCYLIRWQGRCCGGFALQLDDLGLAGHGGWLPAAGTAPLQSLANSNR